MFVLLDNGYLLGAGDRSPTLAPDDGAVCVPKLARYPGLAPGNAPRLGVSIDIAPTIARATNVALLAESDRRAFEDVWDREHVVIESWGNDKGAVPCTGVRTRHETYVEYVDGRRLLWDR